MEMRTYDTGFVRKSGKSYRDDRQETLTRKFSNYISIGVQGYVGSEFEKNRSSKRALNGCVYFFESIKWIFFRRFPNLAPLMYYFEQKEKPVLYCCRDDGEEIPEKFNDVPRLINNPIELVIQNIPHIWGREIALWDEAVKGEECVQNRSGACDPSKWTKQLANDGLIEVFLIRSVGSYLKKLFGERQHLSRIGQFDELTIQFRKPEETLAGGNKHKIDQLCIMVDGEFYTVQHPKSLSIKRLTQILLLGSSPKRSRLVRDEKVTKGS
ncbi:uncharacterized protein VTP21DRAFT_7312 [Calcarisporiella thermophila]|uniref:uncharacterized protein n=1 Tax=Calcarisporiella thermophila TaxID=911321 RepID=UPI003742361D